MKRHGARKALMVLALALPLTGSQLLFGLVPFREQMRALAQRAAACLPSVCAVIPDTLSPHPSLSPLQRGEDGRRPGEGMGASIAVAAVGFAPGRAFLVIPPPVESR